jgi:hypothetical protein
MMRMQDGTRSNPRAKPARSRGRTSVRANEREDAVLVGDELRGQELAVSVG